MDNFKLYQNFNSEYNTSQLGFFRPDTDFVPAIHSISLDIYNKLVGAAPRNQKIQDWLRPFLKTMNVAVQKKAAIEYIPFPKGYDNYSSSRLIVEKERSCMLRDCDLFKDGECIPFDEAEREDFFPVSTELEFRPVTLVPGNEWAAATSHRTKGPTLNRPLIRQIEDGFEVKPPGTGVIVLDFYTKPVEPTFNYTTKVNGADNYLEFSEQGTVHLQWSETLTPVFLYELGKRYGMTIQNQLILQVRTLDKLFE